MIVVEWKLTTFLRQEPWLDAPPRTRGVARLRAARGATGDPTRAWWRVQPRLLTQKRGQFLQQLTPYLDNDSNTHTDIFLNSLYHVIESELAKFDIKIDMLRLLYKTIATSFLTPLSTGEDDVWGVVDDEGEVMKMQQHKLGTMLVGAGNIVWWKLLWFWWTPQPSHWAAEAWKTCNSGIS